MSTDSKIKIYKTAVKSILTYVVKGKPDTAKTKQMSNVEKRVQKSLQDIIFFYRKRNPRINAKKVMPYKKYIG